MHVSNECGIILKLTEMPNKNGGPLSIAVQMPGKKIAAESCQKLSKKEQAIQKRKAVKEIL